MLVQALNSIWHTACLPEASRFAKATRTVRLTQERVLREILDVQSKCEFGRRHDFTRLAVQNNLTTEFRGQIPLASFEDHKPLIDRIAGGEEQILTAEPTLNLEPTGGSSGGCKLIPYTRLLRRQFQRGIAAWVADLFHHRPNLKRGRAYWSISPALDLPRTSPGGVKIGFDDDSDYLRGLDRWLVAQLLVGDRKLARAADLADFRYATLRHLIEADDLALISVWSPTFLTALLSTAEEHWDRLLADIASGSWSGVTTNLSPRRPNPQRARALAQLTPTNGGFASIQRQVWPQLGLISCWGDGASRLQLPGLRDLFPDVEIQPKGLLATECFVTLPKVALPAPALSIRSHFFEFQPAQGDSADPTRLADELELHQTYRVVVTTGGGLYRYRLNDRVRVEGYLNQCPLLSFQGRGDAACDLVGEKLTEAQVAAALDLMFDPRSKSPKFAMLVPLKTRPPRYCLYLQDCRVENSAAIEESLSVKLEECLRRNPHYAYAVSLQQLAAARVKVLNPAGRCARELYVESCMRRGQRLGDIKSVLLHSWSGWADVFE